MIRIPPHGPATFPPRASSNRRGRLESGPATPGGLNRVRTGAACHGRLRPNGWRNGPRRRERRHDRKRNGPRDSRNRAGSQNEPRQLYLAPKAKRPPAANSTNLTPHRKMASPPVTAILRRRALPRRCGWQTGRVRTTRRWRSCSVASKPAPRPASMPGGPPPTAKTGLRPPRYTKSLLLGPSAVGRRTSAWRTYRLWNFTLPSFVHWRLRKREKNAWMKAPF